MALTTVDSNLVWQEVKIMLAIQQASARFGITQFETNAFAALKAHLSQTKGNPNLKVINISGDAIDDPSGYTTVDAACTLYGAFFRKPVTSATDTYVYLLDSATDDTAATLTGASNNVRVVLPFLGVQDEASIFFAGGLVLATGLVVKAYASGGGNANSGAAADPASGTAYVTPNGFVIVGDPI